MRGATRHLDDALQVLDQTGYVGAAHGGLAHAQLAVLVAAHRVDLAARLHHKGRVVLATAHLPYHDVKTAHLRDRMRCLVKTHP